VVVALKPPPVKLAGSKCTPGGKVPAYSVPQLKMIIASAPSYSHVAVDLKTNFPQPNSRLLRADYLSTTVELMTSDHRIAGSSLPDACLCISNLRGYLRMSGILLVLFLCYYRVKRSRNFRKFWLVPFARSHGFESPLGSDV
jgi:hypothetical protein